MPRSSLRVLPFCDADQAQTSSKNQSKHLKFDAKICEPCDTARTQQADRQHDHFNILALARLQADDDPWGIFAFEKYREGTEAYLNVFRGTKKGRMDYKTEKFNFHSWC